MHVRDIDRKEYVYAIISLGPDELNLLDLSGKFVRFFRTRWMHVVRIRATMADGRLVNDVGGPYVLAPASQTLYAAGHRRIGRVTLSVQDDTGFIKLMHRFTGAEVVLRTPRGIVPGSAPNPPPPGPHWQRFTFTGRAFPTGPLTITLLAPV